MRADSRPEDLIALMGSLADATRLRLLRVLECEQLGVAELCQVLQLPQSTVSRHLKLLSDRSWLTIQPRGTANLYRMYADELPPHARQLWQLARDQLGGWVADAQDQLRLTQLISQRRSTSFFAGAVHNWEKLRAGLYGHAFLHQSITALLPREWTVVDLGCGVGELVESLGDRVRHVIGIDQSDRMLARARRRTTRQANVTLLQGDLSAIPLPSSRFDAVLAILVLSYLPEPRKALFEAARVLREGGRAVIVTLLRHDREAFRREMGHLWPGFAPEQLCELLRDAGIAPDSCRASAAEPETKGPALLLAAGIKKAH